VTLRASVVKLQIAIPLQALLHLAAAFSLPLYPSAPAQESLDPGAVARRADPWLKDFASAGDFSGVVLLAQGETILFAQAYGFADPQQRFPNRLDTLCSTRLGFEDVYCRRD